MELYPKEDVEHWFSEWREDLGSHFAIKLFELMSKSDSSNLSRLELAYPEVVEVYKRRLKKN